MSPRRRRVLLLYAEGEHSRTLSYHGGWPRHFQRSPRFACASVNVMDRRLAARLRAHARAAFSQVEAVVVLHSVFSNACYLAGVLFEAIAMMPVPKAYFIGNEYKLMPEKMTFCEELGIDLLVTMNPDPRGQQLYRDRLGCAVVHIPSAAVDPSLFRPVTPRAARPIDLGYRAFDAPLHLGHDERQAMANYFACHAHDLGLTVDISLERQDRFDEPGWAAFLNRCKGQLGTEAGGDYFDLTDDLRRQVTAFLAARPAATIDEIRRRFFDHVADPVPIRTISGRHAEAAATGTVQILFDGRYSGYFEPDVHYIPLRKDFANVAEAVAKFRDDAFCRDLAARAQAVVHAELTYERLINRFADAFERVM